MLAQVSLGGLAEDAQLTKMPTTHRKVTHYNETGKSLCNEESHFIERSAVVLQATTESLSRPIPHQSLARSGSDSHCSCKPKRAAALLF